MMDSSEMVPQQRPQGCVQTHTVGGHMPGSGRGSSARVNIWRTSRTSMKQHRVASIKFYSVHP
eukprot:1143827-Pelagomonas_calceolata.AAC.3